MTFVPRPAWLLALVAAALLTSACAAQGPAAQGSTTGSATATASQSAAASVDTSGLVMATHSECDLGPKILRYLATGDNGGDPQLDVAFSQYVGVPVPQARSVADKYVQQCDDKLDQKASASAAAQGEASASAAAAQQASEQAATRDITQAAACDAIGGTVRDNVCHSTVQGSPGGPGLDCRYAVIAFRSDGNIDPAALADVKKQLPGCFR